jgi:hypothetical protein
MIRIRFYHRLWYKNKSQNSSGTRKSREYRADSARPATGSHRWRRLREGPPHTRQGASCDEERRCWGGKLEHKGRSSRHTNTRGRHFRRLCDGRTRCVLFRRHWRAGCCLRGCRRIPRANNGNKLRANWRCVRCQPCGIVRFDCPVGTQPTFLLPIHSQFGRRLRTILFHLPGIVDRRKPRQVVFDPGKLVRGDHSVCGRWHSLGVAHSWVRSTVARVGRCRGDLNAANWRVL